MNLLLTGGLGYIGSHTAVTLIQLNHTVVLFDDLSNSSKKTFENLTRIIDKSITFIKGNVCQTDQLLEILIDHEIDAVIHFAGLKSVASSVFYPLSYYATNVHGTISLLQAMHQAKVKSLIFSSSATIYGEPKYLPFDENHPTQPVNPYGRSKLYVEEILKDVAQADSSWRIACLRYFNPIGAHDSGLIGEKPSGVPNNLLPFIAQVASGKRKELQVFGDDYPTPDGTGVRDYIDVLDLAAGHCSALSYLKKTPGWSAINLGTGKGYSVMQMVEAFERATGRVIPYRIMPRRPGDIAEFYAAPDKSKKLLGWEAKRPIDESLANAWRFQLNLKT